MPIYEYRCSRCAQQVEVLVRSGEARPTCPACGTALTDKLFSAPIVLRGRASRPAGQTCCGQDERCDAPPCDRAGTCRHD